MGVCSVNVQDPGPKDSRSDGTSENELNNNQIDLFMMYKIE